jgi:N-acetylglutamate synthase-like GNAT family acetyltransferase
MVRIRRVGTEEVALARDLHNRFTAQDRSIAAIRSWYNDVPSLFLFAIEGDEAIGVCTGRSRGENTVSLAGIGVEPNRRGEGIGTELLEQFEENAREAGIERVSVASAGGRVDGFYLENGFKPEKILVMNPAGRPRDYNRTDFDIEWGTNDDGSPKCYVHVSKYDPTVVEQVRDEFEDDHAIYIMVKDRFDQ